MHMLRCSLAADLPLCERARQWSAQVPAQDALGMRATRCFLLPISGCLHVFAALTPITDTAQYLQAYLYCFDFSLIVLTFIIFTIWHFGFYLGSGPWAKSRPDILGPVEEVLSPRGRDEWPSAPTDDADGGYHHMLCSWLSSLHRSLQASSQLAACLRAACAACSALSRLKARTMLLGPSSSVPWQCPARRLQATGRRPRGGPCRLGQQPAGQAGHAAGAPLGCAWSAPSAYAATAVQESRVAGPAGSRDRAYTDPSPSSEAAAAMQGTREGRREKRGACQTQAAASRPSLSCWKRLRRASSAPRPACWMWHTR